MINRPRSIVVLTGAGVSTAAGVPDFRSKGGLFETIRAKHGDEYAELIDEPELMFTRWWRDAHPDLDGITLAWNVPEVGRGSLRQVAQRPARSLRQRFAHFLFQLDL